MMKKRLGTTPKRFKEFAPVHNHPVTPTPRQGEKKEL